MSGYIGNGWNNSKIMNIAKRKRSITVTHFMENRASSAYFLDLFFNSDTIQIIRLGLRRQLPSLFECECMFCYFWLIPLPMGMEMNHITEPIKLVSIHFFFFYHFDSFIPLPKDHSRFTSTPNIIIYYLNLYICICIPTDWILWLNIVLIVSWGWKTNKKHCFFIYVQTIYNEMDLLDLNSLPSAVESI